MPLNLEYCIAKYHYSIISPADGSDYSRTVQIVTFGPEISTQCIEIPILEDDISESPEQFNVMISSDDPDVSSTLPNTEVIITDFDTVTVGLELEVYMAVEDQGMIEVCVVITNGELDREAEVTLTTGDLTAQGT